MPVRQCSAARNRRSGTRSRGGHARRLSGYWPETWAWRPVEEEELPHHRPNQRNEDAENNGRLRSYEKDGDLRRIVIHCRLLGSLTHRVTTPMDIFYPWPGAAFGGGSEADSGRGGLTASLSALAEYGRKFCALRSSAGGVGPVGLIYGDVAVNVAVKAARILQLVMIERVSLRMCSGRAGDGLRVAQRVSRTKSMTAPVGFAGP